MRPTENSSLLDWLDCHARVLFRHHGDGVLMMGAPSPRFYLGRTEGGYICRVRSDVPEAIAAELSGLAVGEPPAVSGLPIHADDYSAILAQQAPVVRRWFGPAYRFPPRLPVYPHRVVRVDQTNIELLRANHADWMADVGTGDPVCVLLARDEAVSICFSARSSAVAREAGVDTLAAHRGQGYAAAVTAYWANLVRRLNVAPLYSTAAVNLASQAVATRLGLVPIGVDFHLT